MPETTCKVILPLVLLWGLPQTCHSTLSPFCGFWQKRKKEMKKLTKNCDGFWLVSSFQHNFLFWHWELGFSKASNFSAHVSLSQINLWKRGCRGLCETCWHSCISLLLKWFGFEAFFNVQTWKLRLHLWFAIWKGLTRKRRNISKFKTRDKPFSDSHVHQTITRNYKFHSLKKYRQDFGGWSRQDSRLVLLARGHFFLLVFFPSIMGRKNQE